MREIKYKVLFGSDIVGRYMSLDTALILIDGLANKYYEEMNYGGSISLTIENLDTEEGITST